MQYSNNFFWRFTKNTNKNKAVEDSNKIIIYKTKLI